MVGGILGLFLGAAAILLGMKGFSPEGLPLTGSRRLTGTTARVIGGACIVLGLAMIAASAWPLLADRG